MKKTSCLLSVLSLAMIVPICATANTIREIQPLLFGTIAIAGAFPQDITLTPYGTESHSTGITPLRGYSSGIFEITDLSPNTSFAVLINDTIVDGPGGATYDITNFTFAPDTSNGVSPADGTASAQADSAGHLTLKVGAKLQIQSSTIYAPGAYRGTYQLVLNF